MKKWFFLGFLALFLIQGPASATNITLSANLTGPGSPLEGGTATFELINYDALNTQDRSFTYTITLFPTSNENLQHLLDAKQGSSVPTMNQYDVEGVRLQDSMGTVFFTFARFEPDFIQSPYTVTGFFTNDPNVAIDAKDGILSGTVSYDECIVGGDGQCAILNFPPVASPCSSDFYVGVVNNDRSYDPNKAPYGADGLTGQLCPAVPAPNSLSLVGIGIAGLGLLRQRRKRRPLALQLADRVSAA
jgi:hypothetical protein